MVLTKLTISASVVYFFKLVDDELRRTLMQENRNYAGIAPSEVVFSFERCRVA